MNPIQQLVEETTIVGIAVRTKNSDEMNPETAQLPELWRRFFEEFK